MAVFPYLIDFALYVVPKMAGFHVYVDTRVTMQFAPWRFWGYESSSQGWVEVFE